MATQQVLVRLPEDLARRFKRHVSDRRRSEFIQTLLEKALPPADGSEEDPLYQAALAVEQDARLGAEMAEWALLPSGDDLSPETGWQVSPP